MALTLIGQWTKSVYHDRSHDLYSRLVITQLSTRFEIYFEALILEADLRCVLNSPKTPMFSSYAIVQSSKRRPYRWLFGAFLQKDKLNATTS